MSSRYKTGDVTTDNALARVSKDMQSAGGNMPTYTVATLSAATSAGLSFVLVSDETGGFTAAFYDGTNWRRVQDRVICS